MNALERLTEVLDQPRERLLQGRAPTDQHIVISRLEPSRVRKPHDFAQSPPYAIPLDRIADLLRHRKADPWRSCVDTRPSLQYECRRGGPGARRGAEKIRPLPQSFHGSGQRYEARQALSRFRPRARRALSTLRPPVVADRLRKPWRRLRTSLLG
jgi:hypothetical protein